MAHLTQQYRKDSVLTTSPELIVLKLYDCFLVRVEQAEKHLSEGERSGTGESISKALAIVNALQEALDRSLGADAVPLLDRLYHTVRGWLVEANVRRQAAPLQHSRRVMRILREGFEGAVRQVG